MSGETVQIPTREDVVALVVGFTRDALERDGGAQSSELSEEAALVGSGAVVDSLGLVQIISDVEDTMSDEYGRPIDLTDERALSQERSPFRTVGTMVDHIMTCLGAPAGL
jgi:acyl carrier protein